MSLFLIVGFRALSEAAQFRQLRHKTAVTKGTQAAPLNVLHTHTLSLSPSLSQLLGELLLDRHNFTTMTRYISNPENLKLMMMMLRDPSRNIQFEAFHVFKV